jgi:hypothetical protein
MAGPVEASESEEPETARWATTIAREDEGVSATGVELDAAEV